MPWQTLKLLLEATRGGAAYHLWMDPSTISDASRHDVAAAAYRQHDDHPQSPCQGLLSIEVSSDDAVSDCFGRWVG